MRGIRVMLGAVLAAAAFAGLTAGTASAKPLVLREELGGPLATGAEVAFFIQFSAAECVVEGYGFVSVNSSHRDVINNPVSTSYCEDEQVPVGVQEVELTSSGNGTVVTAPGSPIRIEPFLEGCVYEFKKLAGFFTSPGRIRISGSSKGKLSKAHSTATGCEKKLSTEFTADVEAESEVL